MSLYNWYLHIDGNTLKINHAKDVQSVNSHDGPTRKGFGSESGARHKTHENNYIVKSEVVNDIAINETHFRFLINDIWYNADWGTRYQNKSWPHHKTVDEIEKLYQAAKRRKII